LDVEALFIPLDSALSTALEQNLQLMENAFSEKIVLTLLIILLANIYQIKGRSPSSQR